MNLDSKVKLSFWWNILFVVKERYCFYIKVNDGNQYNEPIYHLITLRNVFDRESYSLAHQYTLTTMDGFIIDEWK